MYHTLTHHGILGQKWGKRNGPPYPLDESDHSAAEKRAAKGSSVKKSDSGEKTERKGLTDGQKRAIKIGAAVVGTALLAYGGYTLYKSGKLNPVIDKFRKEGENSVKGTADFADITPQITPQIADDNVFKESAQKEGIRVLEKVPKGDERSIDYIEQSLSTLNPTGANNNCPGIAAALDLQARGLNVCAQGRPYPPSSMKEMYPDYELKPVESFEAFKKLAETFPEGSRGQLSAVYKEEVFDLFKQTGGSLDGFDVSNVKTIGHAYPWEIKNGKMILCNGQTDAHVYTDDEVNFIVNNMLKSDGFKYERLDNLNVDLEGVSIEMSNVMDIIEDSQEE